MSAAPIVPKTPTPRRICGRCKASAEHVVTKTRSLAFVPFVGRVLCAVCCAAVLADAVERMGV